MSGKTQNNVIYVLAIAALIIALSGCEKFFIDLLEHSSTGVAKLITNTVWQTVSEKQLGTYADTLYKSKVLDTASEKRTRKLLVDIVPAVTKISGKFFSGSINFYVLEDYTEITWPPGKDKSESKTTKMLCLFEVGLEKSPKDPSMFKIHIWEKSIKPEFDNKNGHYIIFRDNKLFINDRVVKTNSHYKPIPCDMANTVSHLIEYTIMDKWLAKQKQALESKHKPIEPYEVFYNDEEVTLFATKK